MIRATTSLSVTPAKAGVQGTGTALTLDSRLRGNDVETNTVILISEGSLDA